MPTQLGSSILTSLIQDGIGPSRIGAVRITIRISKNVYILLWKSTTFDVRHGEVASSYTGTEYVSKRARRNFMERMSVLSKSVYRALVLGRACFIKVIRRLCDTCRVICPQLTRIFVTFGCTLHGGGAIVTTSGVSTDPVDGAMRGVR